MAWSSSGRRAQLPKGWSSRIVPRILARDGHRCVARLTDGTRCTETERLEVDHIGDPLNHGDANLQTLCRRHHKRKTQAESAQARRARPKERRRRPAERHPGLL
ncbi:HNH endonuclease [Streptomyces hoynatensis]|uniref:HNH endonuclease n=1 Tax=Streptomyces hoynatensis TaxID=1141874 RepID=A0A3A9YXM9_9ACTN|nr:HNH endonuclease signature motif containing protein [Streptomyces hoynatensis]RKN40798.1 HNH endonuclease [Streptomyces hoynatensis]